MSDDSKFEKHIYDSEKKKKKREEKRLKDEVRNKLGFLGGSKKRKKYLEDL